MTKTWLADFHEKTDLNRYPTVAFRGGVGYRKPTGETVSNFVGHPVHYFHNGLWKPITLQKHANGDLEGSDFGWNGGHVTYKKRPLFQPKAVIFNGVRYNLNLKWNGSSLTCDLPFGVYEVRFTEKGVKELLTIPDPVEGLIEFDVHHENKPEGLYKKNRHIVGGDFGDFGESFILTKDMKYPLEIDPDYAAGSNDGRVTGLSTTYATARSTAFAETNGEDLVYIGQILFGADYYIHRSFILFDTSGIPDGDVVSDAVTKLVTTDDSSATDFDVEIVKQDWSGEEPLSSGNKETAYDGCLSGTLDAVWRNTSGMSVNTQYTSPSLDTSRISKTGNTYFSLRSSRDSGNTAPSGNEYIGIATQEHVTSGYRPVLTVTHAAAATSVQVIWFS